jgi:hypothetical protein
MQSKVKAEQKCCSGQDIGSSRRSTGGWQSGSSGRVPAQQVQSPEFKPQCRQKKKEEEEEKD